MKWKTTNPTKKYDMDSARIAIGLAVVAITTAINYGCLIGIYRLIVRDIAREDRRFVSSVYIGAILLSGIVTMLAAASILIENGYTE